jgi:PAS domain S-box-containing protein
VDLDPHRLRAAFDRAPQPLVLVDAHTFTVLAVNGTARELVGEGAEGRSVTDWPDPRASYLVERLAAVRAGGEPFHAPAWQVAPERWVDLTVTPLLDEDGKPWALLVLARDVTDAAPAGRSVAATATEGDLVARLQDALLPAGLPVLPGARVAARYLLAQDDRGAGGDWFDAVPMPDGGVVVAVADVAGHGTEAAALAAQMRVLFEEAVRREGDLGAALAALEDRVRWAPEARATTLCAARFDPTSATLEYVTSGHPPPVLVAAGGEATYLPPSGAGPLGSGLPHRAERCRLTEGDLVLLYTDGLVERPGRSLAQNTIDLVTTVGDVCRARSDEPLVDRVCRLTPELLTRGTGYDDDIALLALQAVPRVTPLELRLPAVPETVRAVRAVLSDWLGALGVGPVDHTALQHAVGELVTNAVEHAYADPGPEDVVCVDVRLLPDGVVEVAVRDTGEWREPVAGDRGRGLAMARGLADDLRVESDAAGTWVRARHRVSRPAQLLRGASTAAGGPRPRRAGRVTVRDGVLSLAGLVDRDTAAELRAALALASWGGVRPVTVELADTELLSSAAVQALYDARAAGPVELVAPLGSPAQHVLDLVGLSYAQRQAGPARP